MLQLDPLDSAFKRDGTLNKELARRKIRMHIQNKFNSNSSSQERPVRHSRNNTTGRGRQTPEKSPLAGGQKLSESLMNVHAPADGNGPYLRRVQEVVERLEEARHSNKRHANPSASVAAVQRFSEHSAERSPRIVYKSTPP